MKKISHGQSQFFFNIYARSKLKRKTKATKNILPQRRRKGVGKIRQETNSRRAVCSSFISSPEDKCSRSRSNSKTRIILFFNEAKLTIMSSQLNSAQRILFLKLNIRCCSKNILSG
uniref:Uncharacterized protein n=1 Tax=Micrurus carvalhoi TaxID=3147026 RepID=A0A2H6NC99_9SAUR